MDVWIYDMPLAGFFGGKHNLSFLFAEMPCYVRSNSETEFLSVPLGRVGVVYEDWRIV